MIKFYNLGPDLDPHCLDAKIISWHNHLHAAEDFSRQHFQMNSFHSKFSQTSYFHGLC